MPRRANRQSRREKGSSLALAYVKARLDPFIVFGSVKLFRAVESGLGAEIESLPGEGLELRFMLKLRVQNPGDTDLQRVYLAWSNPELTVSTGWGIKTLKRDDHKSGHGLPILIYSLSKEQK